MKEVEAVLVAVRKTADEAGRDEDYSHDPMEQIAAGNARAVMSCLETNLEKVLKGELLP